MNNFKLKEIMSAINLSPITINPDDTKCSICLDTVHTTYKPFIVHAQKHFFHVNCLTTWMQFGHSTCPECRGSLVPEPAPQIEVQILPHGERVPLIARVGVIRNNQLFDRVIDRIDHSPACKCFSLIIVAGIVAAIFYAFNKLLPPIDSYPNNWGGAY